MWMKWYTYLCKLCMHGHYFNTLAITLRLTLLILLLLLVVVVASWSGRMVGSSRLKIWSRELGSALQSRISPPYLMIHSWCLLVIVLGGGCWTREAKRKVPTSLFFPWGFHRNSHSQGLKQLPSPYLLAAFKGKKWGTYQAIKFYAIQY